MLYPAKLSFRIIGQIKSFPDKKKVKEFVNTKPVLQQMLKGLQGGGRVGGRRREKEGRGGEGKKQKK